MMNLQVADSLQVFNWVYIRKLVSPFCGLIRDLGEILPQQNDPKVYLYGANLCGVHRWLGRSDPGASGYHIGGIGLTRDEAKVKAMVESVERYAQLTAFYTSHFKKRRCSARVLKEEGCNWVGSQYLAIYDDSQKEFELFSEDTATLWIEVPQILHEKEDPIWVPAHLFFVGYNLSQGEMRWGPAFTTGTASHRTMDEALLAGVLELIQIDRAMGHWYGNLCAQKVNLDGSQSALKATLDRVLAHSENWKPEFFLLGDPKFPPFVSLCSFQNSSKEPYFVAGLGVDLDAEKSLYKSFLEAVGVGHLARMLNLEAKVQDKLTEGNFTDLDSNVLYYSKISNQKTLEKFLRNKLPSNDVCSLDELPRTKALSAKDAWAGLKSRLCEEGIRILGGELTLREEIHGIRTMRTWSPDLLALALPGVVPIHHPRWKVYGGVQHSYPHPYP